MATQELDVTKLPEVNEHVEFGKEVVAQAQDFTIQTLEDMDLASGIRQKIKERNKAITSLLDPFVKAAHALHKSHTTHRNTITAPLKEAEGIISKKMIEWQTIENARIAEEQKQKDEEARLEAAIKAEEENNEELAEAIMEEQVPVTAAPVEKKAVNGVSFTEKWTFEIENEDEIPREYMIPNEKAIRARVIAMKSKANIPGVRIFAEQGIKSKSGAMSKRPW